SKLLPPKSITDMYFHHRGGYPLYGIANTNGGVGIGPGIQDNALISFKTAIVQFIYDLSFYIGLIIFQLHLLELELEGSKILLKGCFSVNLRFALAQKVQIWSVYNDNLHGIK